MPIKDYHDYSDPSSMYDLDRSGFGVSVRPSEGPPKAFIYLGAAIIVAGVIGFIALLVITIAGAGEGTAKLVAPGEVVIAFDRADSYSVYYEYIGEVDGKYFNTPPNFPGLNCSLTGEDNGQEIRLVRPGGRSTYASGSSSGVKVFKFDITTPGSYRFRAGYLEGETGPEVVLVVGEDLVGKVLIGVFGGFGILFGSLALALPLIIITASKRAKAAAANRTDDFEEEG